VREFWNVGFGPITDLAPLLEYNGIIVVEEPVNCDDMDAVSRWQGGRPYMLCAADQESNSRKLFILAHELAHLVLHNAIEVNSRNLDRMKNQANRFAGAFLMPRRTFAREIANTTIDYFMSLKGRWRVAVAAMIYRCKELGILNPDQVKYLWKQMNARGIRKKEPLDNAFALSRPTVLASATQMLIDNRIKLPAQIAEDLVMNGGRHRVNLRTAARHAAEQGGSVQVPSMKPSERRVGEARTHTDCAVIKPSRIHLPSSGAKVRVSSPAFSACCVPKAVSKLLIFLDMEVAFVPFCSRSFHPIRCDFVAAPLIENNAC
jgi:Zn-dependent peptidase ImmA (M78 family)